jgi:hypothetical protein
MMAGMLTRRVVIYVAILGSFAMTACGGSGRGFTRQYEYEQDITLDLDGSAEIVINSSIPALVALHGLPLPLETRARLDRNVVRRAFESSVTEVTRVSRPWRRQGRRFIQVRLSVADIRQLSKAPPFTWGQYELQTQDGRTIYKERIAGPRREPPVQPTWDGSELVAFKLHLPSRIYYQNVRDLETNQPGSTERGNILRWEQRLSDRLAGVPIDMEVRMDNQSILYRTLWLFAGAFAAAMAVLVALVWWTIRRGRQRQVVAGGAPPRL